MKTTENNKLIAEFMGAKKSPHFEDDYEMYGIIECIKDGENEWHFFHPQDMEFQTSWDWLMPAYKKCMTSKQLRGDDDYRTILIDAVIAADIKELYTAVVEFIKWYNENK